MSKLTIHIDGYGDIRVKKPKHHTDETFSDGVADAVAKTMQLIVTPPRTFHPALGFETRDHA